MPGPLDRATYAAITRLPLLQWRPDAIAEREHVSTRVVYNIEANLFEYALPRAPRLRTIGCPRRITTWAGE